MHHVSTSATVHVWSLKEGEASNQQMDIMLRLGTGASSVQTCTLHRRWLTGKVAK